MSCAIAAMMNDSALPMRAPGRSNGGWLFWYGGGFVAAVGIGWLAALLHAAGYAPLGIISLGVGLALGAALHALATYAMTAAQGVASRRRQVAGAVLLGLVVVLAQHAWLYRDFRQQWHEARARSPEVAMFRPEAPWSPREYFAREMSPRRVALWSIDAVLVTAAAVGTVLVMHNRLSVRPRRRR